MDSILISGLLDLVNNLEVTSRKASSRRSECKTLADLMMGLRTLLSEVRGPRNPSTLSVHAMEAFRLLNNALIRATIAVEKITESSMTKRLFRDMAQTEELRSAISEIQDCVFALPLKMSAELLEQIKHLDEKLQEGSKDLKESQSILQDFKSEFMELLRLQNTSGASSSRGNAEVMDSLLSWLAKRFDSNVDTVRKEWQDMKDEVRSMKVEIQGSSDAKQKLENELLMQVMFISEMSLCSKCASQGNKVQCSRCHNSFDDPLCSKCASEEYGNHLVATSGYRFDGYSLPDEFKCSICLDIFDEPVTIGSGVTFCKRCIWKWFEDNDTCPVARSKVNEKTLTVNLAIKNFISRALQTNRWKETAHSGTLIDSMMDIEERQEEEAEVPISLNGLDISRNETISRFSGEEVQNVSQLTSSRTFRSQPCSSQPSSSQPSSSKYSGFQFSSPQLSRTLEDLISSMQSKNKDGRLKAAKTVIDMLGEEEVKACVMHIRGIVTAFYQLTEVGQEKVLRVKGLKVLSGENGNSADDTSLAITLLRLSALVASPQVVEESLLALCSLVEIGTDEIVHTLSAEKATPHLVRLISNLPTGRGRGEAVKILNRMASLPDLLATMIKHNLFDHLFLLLDEANEGDSLTAATRLLSTGLTSLRETFLRKESNGFRGEFLRSGGVATLGKLAGCTQVGALKMDIAKIFHILAEYQSFHKDIVRQGGEQILYCLLLDDNLDLCSEALFALKCLMTREDLSVSLVGFPFYKVVDILLSSNNHEYREAAIEVLFQFACRVSDASIVWDGKKIKRLLDLVGPHDLPNSIRKRAADTLLLIARRDSSCCTSMIEADGLQIVVEFLKALGPELKPMIIQFLTICCKLDDKSKYAVLEVDGVNLLLEALEMGRMKIDSAIALGDLIERDRPFRQAVLKSKFIEKSVLCILQDNGGFQCSVHLTRSLTRVIDSETIAVKIRESDGIKALICVLEGGNDIGRKLAAKAITQLIKLDGESSLMFAKMSGVNLLCNILTSTGLNSSELSNFDEMETLEALSYASDHKRLHGLVADHKSLRLLGKESRIIPGLLSVLSNEDATVKELILNILLNLSREGAEPDILKGDGLILSSMVSARTCKYVFDIVNSQSPYVTDEAIIKAIGIIRNLSCFGPARKAMLNEDDGAIKVLLDRIKMHDQDASLKIVQGAVMALDKFLLDREGQMALVKYQGIGVIMQVLQHRPQSGKGNSFATETLITSKSFATNILLSMIAELPEISTSTQVCDVVPGIRDILEHASNGECKRKACSLLTRLIDKDPTDLVCQRIRDEDCVTKLLELKSNLQCRKEAIQVLDLLKKKDKESKKLIEADRKKQGQRGILRNGVHW